MLEGEDHSLPPGQLDLRELPVAEPECRDVHGEHELPAGGGRRPDRKLTLLSGHFAAELLQNAPL